jgi:uncharacterized membrane protein
MFGIGTILVMIFLAVSTVASIYECGRYSAKDAKDKIQKAKDVRNTQALAVVFDIVLIALLYFLH